jgi:hypothetical protein
MTLELIEEINPMNGTMYAVKADNQVVKWFMHKGEAERFYELVKANPSEIEPKKTVLKSTEISQ